MPFLDANGLKRVISKLKASSSNGAEFHEYSTEEHIVGTWVDGRPVYERVFIPNNVENVTGSDNVNTWRWVNEPFPEFDMVVDAYAYCKLSLSYVATDNNHSNWYKLPVIPGWGDNKLVISGSISSTSITPGFDFSSYYAFPKFVIFRYVKKT